jgi:hypothetical protein
VEKIEVEVVIENNLGASYYNFRYKGSYSEEWAYYPFDIPARGYNLYSFFSVPNKANSTSDYTIIPLTFLPDSITEGGQVDFQVQALFGGFDSSVASALIPMGPTYDFYFTGTTSGWSETVAFIYDLTPPYISILSPQQQDPFSQQQDYFTSNVDLIFLASEPLNQTAYSLDGEEKVPILGNITLSGLSVGLHTVTVYGWDIVGNAGTSTTVTFEVKAPFLTEIIVIAIVSAVLIGIGALVYFKKRKH